MRTEPPFCAGARALLGAWLVVACSDPGATPSDAGSAEDLQVAPSESDATRPRGDCPAKPDLDGDGIGDVCDGCPDVSADETPRWRAQDSGTTADLFQPFFVNGFQGWVSGRNGTILHTKDGGQHWTEQRTFPDQLVENIVFLDTERGFAVGGSIDATGFALATEDGGSHWRQIQKFPGFDLHGLSVPSPRDVWANGHNGMLVHSKNGGSSWDEISIPTAEDMYHDIGFLSPEVGFALGHHGRVFRTRDGGRAWRSLSDVGHIEFWDLAVVDEAHLWIVGDGGHLFATDDGGKTWHERQVGTTVPLYGVFFADPDVGWVVGDRGFVASSKDGGKTWKTERLDTTESLLKVRSLGRSAAWVAGAGGTIYRYCGR